MPALRRLTPEKCRYVEPDLVSGGLAHGRARLFDPGLLHCRLGTHWRRLPLCCWRRLPPPEGPRDRAEQAGPGWFGPGRHRYGGADRCFGEQASA
jgi:hypothetical protein